MAVADEVVPGVGVTVGAVSSRVSVNVLFPVCEVMLSVTQIRSVFVPTVSELACIVTVFVVPADAVPVVWTIPVVQSTPPSLTEKEPFLLLDQLTFLLWIAPALPLIYGVVIAFTVTVGTVLSIVQVPLAVLLFVIPLLIAMALMVVVVPLPATDTGEL